jgi:hypothetical protein
MNYTTGNLERIDMFYMYKNQENKTNRFQMPPESILKKSKNKRKH